ncbi:MAG: thioredoxin domain-containing protein [Robiginitalea sp.]
MNHSEPNALIHESSPYLLQHAYNPVQWEGWHDATLEHAQKSGKLLLISIGYAACHWCHVMEHECFEDPEVADVMNVHFIPIKVDREERPDVDQIYMDALQIMSGSGGWPLNVVALPDGRPFWGATYVPKKDWIRVLLQLAQLYREDPGKVEQYASDLTSALERINEVAGGSKLEQTPGKQQLADWVGSWKKGFDLNFGGKLGAPKFMTPVLYEFMMHWGEVSGEEDIRTHVRTTLDGMGYGGVYDQIGGGFSRYSVDPKWHVPHFEKMLYDNAQLLSLYAQGYALHREPNYKHIVLGTLSFLERELRRPEGGYYASLDADSLNEAGTLEEGAYYTWTKKELQSILGKEYAWFQAYYNVNDFGHWEKDRYVLIRKGSDREFCKKMDWTQEELQARLSRVKARLLQKREERPRPRLDDKLITSWNGLLLGGFCDVYRYCDIQHARTQALELAAFIEKVLSRQDGGLIHSFKPGGKAVNGYLEDYAAVIQGYLKLYTITGDAAWMERSKGLSDYCLEYYASQGQPLLFFSSNLDRPLIRRTLEVNDSVIPSSNSMMAKNLFLLGSFFAIPAYRERAISMLEVMGDSIERYAGQYPNWLQLALWLDRPFYEVAITGPGATESLKALLPFYLPHTFLAGSPQEMPYPLFTNRHSEEDTRIFLCEFGQCQKPLTDVNDVLAILEKNQISD